MELQRVIIYRRRSLEVVAGDFHAFDLREPNNPTISPLVAYVVDWLIPVAAAMSNEHLLLVHESRHHY